MPRFEKGPDGIVHQFPDDATDAEVAAALDSLDKSHHAPAPATAPFGADIGLAAIKDLGIGALKGAGHTVKTLADLGRQHLPGFADLDKVGHIQVGTTLEPSNTTQKIGKTAEQMAEWVVPGELASTAALKATPKLALMLGTRAAPLVAEGLAQGAMSVPMAVAHGEDPRIAAATGAIMPAALAGTGALVKATANKVAPAALRRLMPELAHHSEDFGDLTQFAREQQTPIGGSKIQSDLSKGQAKKVDYLLGLRDEARPAVVAPGARSAAEADLARTATPGATTTIGGASTRPTIAGLLPEATTMHPLGPTPGPGQMPLRLGQAQAKALPRPPMSTMPGGGRFAEHIPGVDPVETVFTSRSLTPEGSHTFPLQAPELAGPGVVRRPLNAPNQWKPGQGAGAQMVDPLKDVSGPGLRAARTKLADSTDTIGDLAALDALEGKYLASRQQPQTLAQTKRTARMANNDAHNAYLATKQGKPEQAVPSLFNKAIGGQSNAIVRARAPEVIKYDDLAQKHLGLSRVLYDAQEAAKLHPFVPLKPGSWITPRMESKLIYKGDTLAGKTAAALASQKGGQRGILLARLLAQLGGGS